MSEATRRIELAADFFIDTVHDLIPRGHAPAAIQGLIEEAAMFTGQATAWPTYEYHWKGPYKWKHGPEKGEQA